MKITKLGNNVRSFRRFHRWTIPELARRAKLHSNTILYLELGQVSDVKLGTVCQLAKALRVKVAQLLRGAV